MAEKDTPKHRFNTLIDSAPNELTTIITCHHAIEAEIHRTLEEVLSRSSRLDLHRLPFLTKVDLLIALGVLREAVFPIFKEVNRLRNRFAHNPEASFTDEDETQIRNVFGSLVINLLPPDWKWEGIDETVNTLLNVTFINIRVAFERAAKRGAEEHAIAEILRTQFPEMFSPTKDRAKSELAEEYERLAKEYLLKKHPEVEYPG